MNTKKYSKQIIAIILMILILLIINTGKVNAALQANPNTQYKKEDTPANWMTNFRKMENAGGAMGLSETLNADLTSAESNNIDVHMMKSTEYGAIAILSASGYGNPSNATAITTTTGNNTGIMLNTGNWEWVAGGLSGSIFSGVNSRYVNKYTAAKTSAKIGDALGEASVTNPGCAGWHKASYSNWVTSSYPYFNRGSGGIFSFNNNNAGNKYYSRGVAVCGAGLLYRMKCQIRYFKIRGENFKEFSEYFLYIKET